MANRTFTMSADQFEGTGPQPHRALQLVLSPESHYLSMSPDSDSSISNPSDGEASSSPDINVRECCINECSPLDSLCNATLTQGTSTNMNQTFIATPVNGSMNFWNENLNPMSSEHHGSEKYQTLNKLTEDESNSTGISPDSAGMESQLSSYETSCRGSTENECCFLSSGEMLMRSNSFCLEDQSVLVVSSLDESSLSPTAGCAALPADSNLLSPALPIVCEKSIERVTEENTGNPCLGMTFTHSDNWELHTEENDIETSSSPVPLPSDNEVGLLMTFVYETSAESRKETKFASADGDPIPYFLGTITPEQGKNCATLTPNLVQESDKDIHTSTPVQNTGNQIPSLPSLSQSPCIGNAISPKRHSVKERQSSVTPKQRLLTRVPPSGSKVKKFEIKKFPKSDFSNVKSKVITRATHQTTVQGPASQQNPSQVNVDNKHTDVHRATTIRVSPAKTNSSNAVSATTKMFSAPQRRVNTGVANLGVNVIQSSGHTVVNGQEKIRASPPEKHVVATDHASAIQCSNASSETNQTASNQESDASAQQAGSQTFCLSSLGKTRIRSGQKDLKPTAKKEVSEKIEVRSDSAVGQDRPPVLKTRPRCSSESSTSRSPKEKRRTLTVSASFTVPKADCHLSHTKPGNLNGSSRHKRPVQAEEANGCTENPSREVKKISLMAEFDNGKTRFRGRPSPRRAASPRPATLSDRQRRGTRALDECRTSKAVETTQSKQRSITGIQKSQPTGEPTHGTATVKPQWCGSRPSQTTTRPSLMGLPPTPGSRLPRKTLGPARSLNEASVHSELSHSTGNTQVCGGAANKQTPVKSVLKARVISTPGKNTGPTLTTACKPAVSSDKGVSNSTFSPLKRSASARFVRSSSGPVDKNKSKPSCRQQPPHQPASQLNQTNGCQDGIPASFTECARKDKNIQQLKGLLTASNRRFEAVALVLQKTLAERDEATKQCRELSQELVNLRGELVCSVHSSERLEKEKEELRVALEDALQKLQEQHQNDLSELEQRLQAFYQAEWDKVHLTYQEEADKSKTLMQQQMVELKASHEATKLELENSHVEQLQCFKQQYEMSLEELRKVHNEELQSLGKTLKDAEDALSRQIQELTAENNALIEKLTAEENRRKELAEKSQKDSHTEYLEHELESLKVVLDIKTKQLHQQEKKLLEIEKLTEKNLKLDESLKKITQENEDLKARMERHAALSRQLSTEQAVLQESLHKESKVNKRLSMENEELLWKLHNGDLSSPRKVSPSSTSPSHSFSFQSPRSSGIFSSPPVSPR